MIKDAYRQDDRQNYVGDDLSEDQLLELYDYFTGGLQKGYMASWWEDKSHQIGYRLLMRMVRAEDELSKLKFDSNA